MSFAFLPKGEYKIGQIINVHGEKMKVTKYSHTGKNLEAVTLDNAPVFKRKTVILTDEPAIVEVTK
mgnify:CR=1 FL=1